MQYQPPSQPEPEGTTFDISQIPKPELTGHAWRQMGPYVYCQSCTFKHSSYIGTDLQLTGITEDGYPTFKKLSVKR